MQRVFVLDNQKRPLMPCHPARARALLDKGKAADWMHHSERRRILDMMETRAQDACEQLARPV